MLRKYWRLKISENNFTSHVFKIRDQTSMNLRRQKSSVHDQFDKVSRCEA